MRRTFAPFPSSDPKDESAKQTSNLKSRPPRSCGDEKKESDVAACAEVCTLVSDMTTQGQTAAPEERLYQKLISPWQSLRRETSARKKVGVGCACLSVGCHVKLRPGGSGPGLPLPQFLMLDVKMTISCDRSAT